MCAVSGVPVLIVKGVCKESPIDFLYYIEKDEKDKIFYEGYKRSKILLVNGSWIIVDPSVKETDMRGELLSGQENSDTPVGRHTWNVLDTSCGIDRVRKVNLTLSVCKIDEHFTCDSGECVDIFNRCDNSVDCRDESDENDCKIIRIPSAYNKAVPPELGKDSSEANPINTASMTVGLTVSINLQ